MNFLAGLYLVVFTFVISSVFYDYINFVIAIHVITGLTIILSNGQGFEDSEEEKIILKERKTKKVKLCS